MAKIKKKGTSGQAKNFITRTQAVRKLQISLPDFRRLCIYKGIYPREPRNKKKASKTSTPSTTFYYTRDIQYLLHEPILNKFRDHKALAKKIARSLGRGEIGDAARLEKTAKPRITLDHIIKERYPTFVDALRDLDDALSLLFLFANLPSTSTVPPKTITLCQRLCLEFEHYLITTHSLRKSFISIKGIYYQATIQGQDILWLVPHKFVQRVTGDVDFRIMGTFVEFYTTLLGFVNYRLYTSIGLLYPPKFNAKSDERGGELSAFTLEGADFSSDTRLTNGEGHNEQRREQEIVSEEGGQLAQAEELVSIDPTMEDDTMDKPEVQEEGADTIDKFEVQGEGADVLDQPRTSDTEAGLLFAPYSFFLSRETPRQPLELLLRSFGCKRIGWNEVLGDGAFTNDEFDPSITHQIVDRPPMQQTEESQTGAVPRRMPGRTYVQPQWVWDCINEGKLLRPDQYAPGATLPPHLSPWVKPTRSAYDPTLPLAAQEAEAEAESAGLDEEEQQELDQLTAAEDEEDGQDAVQENGDDGMDVASGDSEDQRSEVDDFGRFASDDLAVADEEEAEDPRSEHQKELEAEAAGLTFTETAPNGKSDGSSTGRGKRKQDELRRKRKEEEEELERRKMMMSKKKRKLFEKMAYSNRQKDDEAAKLRSKRRKLEKAKG
ncbi:MAG: hypothetical protein L6R39_000239 [Caloplaca ligustica]|nr:MAG: hypothetical protein L6R39_000239 [Caloplaca ligustica]